MDEPDASRMLGGASTSVPEGSVPKALARTIAIRNRRGLHARAAAKFASLAERFDASVDVAREDQVVSARSIMGLMMLGAGLGASIEIRAEGVEASAALDALVALVDAGFGESD